MYDRFFFKMTDGNIYNFASTDPKKASFDLASKIQATDFKWEKLTTKKIQNIVDMYKGIQLNFYHDKPCCFIPHTRFLSLFDISNWTWVRHFVFDSDILKTFRSSYSGEWTLLKDGRCFVNWKFYDGDDVVGSRGNAKNIYGKIIRTNEDVESNLGFYATVLNNNNEYELWILYKE